MGVPKSIDGWVYLLASVCVVVIDDIIEQDKWDKVKEAEYDGEEVKVYIKSLNLEGKEVGKIILEALGMDTQTFLNSKMFQDFPLYNPELNIGLALTPDNMYEKEKLGGRVEASHSYTGNISDIKLRKLGGVTIFSRNKFDFKFILPYSYATDTSHKKNEKLINDIIPTIGHELTHSYQSYKQLEGGQKGVGFGKETILNALPQQMQYAETPSWNYFLHLIYLHLSFEVNARVTEMYYEMRREGIKTQEQALRFLKKSEPWQDYEMLKNFTVEKFMDEFEAELGDDDPLFNLLTGGGLPKSNEEWQKQLISVWDGMIQSIVTRYKELGINTPEMDRVPKMAKENPQLFFKFFEKRFHKKAEKLRRKLIKVVSLILQEAEENRKKEDN